MRSPLFSLPLSSLIWSRSVLCSFCLLFVPFILLFCCCCFFSSLFHKKECVEDGSALIEEPVTKRLYVIKSVVPDVLCQLLLLSCQQRTNEVKFFQNAKIPYPSSSTLPSAISSTSSTPHRYCLLHFYSIPQFSQVGFHFSSGRNERWDGLPTTHRKYNFIGSCWTSLLFDFSW